MYFSRTQLIYLFFLISHLLAGCESKKQVDLSAIDLEVHVERFDRSLDSITSTNLSESLPLLKERYDPFFTDFIEQILAVGSSADTAYYRDLQRILVDPEYERLHTEVNTVFPNLENTEQELTDAFRHVRYYYPKQKIPRLISFFSGFAIQTPIGNDYIGIGLDMFLGSDSKFYPALRESIPYYLARRFTPENITPRVIETFAREEMFPAQDADRSLLAKMVYNGKILYFMSSVMPEVADSLIIGETAEQLDWSEANEASIWGYFLEEELLYETDHIRTNKYLTEAPFTPGIGENNKSAPKLGVWAGWRIVKKYMENNQEITLQELMQEKDYQKILNRSKYKPK